MAKQAKTTPAQPGATPARKRAPAYKPESKIAIVTGDDARRVVRNLSCDRAMQAMKSHATVGEFVKAFGAACDKAPLPGRSGQPGHVQAAAILRFLEREGAVTVR
jgi:hypothetical protein